jgi:predicted TIM-barrel fold metal-dependent hydrolase
MRDRYSRRHVLRTLAACAAASLPSLSSAESAKRGRIDVHHHMVPPLLDVWTARHWSPEVSLEAMDKYGTETAMLSATGLPPAFADLFYDGSERARGLVRKVNEYGAKIVSDRPQRFGFFAALPLPAADATLKEIEYAFDTLKADGVAVFSNTGSKWLGDPAFSPIFEELHRRKAVVFIHPSVPNCCRNLVSGIPDTVLEFDFDTTRAVTSLLYNGVLGRMPDIRFIVNHSGAAVPVMSGRIRDEVRGQDGIAIPNGQTGAWDQMRKLYFEVAHAAYPAPLGALMKFAPVSQFLFGTDFPVWPYSTTADQLPNTKLSSQTKHALDRGNAERLFPRLKA